MVASDGEGVVASQSVERQEVDARRGDVDQLLGDAAAAGGDQRNQARGRDVDRSLLLAKSRALMIRSLRGLWRGVGERQHAQLWPNSRTTGQVAVRARMVNWRIEIVPWSSSSGIEVEQVSARRRENRQQVVATASSK